MNNNLKVDFRKDLNRYFGIISKVNNIGLFIACKDGSNGIILKESLEHLGMNCSNFKVGQNLDFFIEKSTVKRNGRKKRNSLKKLYLYQKDSNGYYFVSSVIEHFNGIKEILGNIYPNDDVLWRKLYLAGYQLQADPTTPTPIAFYPVDFSDKDYAETYSVIESLMWDDQLTFAQLWKFYYGIKKKMEPHEQWEQFRHQIKEKMYLRRIPFKPDIETGKYLYKLGLITDNGQLTDIAYEVMDEAFNPPEEPKDIDSIFDALSKIVEKSNKMKS